MKPEISADEQWRLLLGEGKMPAARQRLAVLYSLIPAGSRCRICKVPFSGPSGQIMRALGKSPSSINPHICSACDTFARWNPGGAELRLSMLFADIRGSTGLAEQMASGDFRRLIDRFYATATDVLCQYNALIDKLAGDQVSGYFVPGLAGTDHARVAVNAARELLRATGHDEPGGPWIPVGVGVHTGEAFFGSVGTRGGMVDVTALGDAVNIAARLASQAGPGEVMMSQDTYREAGLDLGDLEQKDLDLKGRSQPVSVYVL